ncbi:hypothetical protein ACWFRJ_43485 [Streptomyces sp. NPDC055239]
MGVCTGDGVGLDEGKTVATRLRLGRGRTVLAVTALGAVALSAAPAAASENVIGIGNAAFNNTMINANKQVTAVARTEQGSGVLGNLNQLPVDIPQNGGAGGSNFAFLNPFSTFEAPASAVSPLTSPVGSAVG